MRYNQIYTTKENHNTQHKRMKISPHHLGLLIPFVLVLFSSYLCETCQGALLRTNEVEIKNGLSPKSDLIVHCKSKDDGLGAKHLHNNDHFSFRFKENIYGRTLFFCGFTWRNEFHWFTIYNALVYGFRGVRRPSWFCFP